MPGLTGLLGYRATRRGLTPHTFFFENASKRLHARQSSPPTRGTLSTCPRHPVRRGSFLPCKLFEPGLKINRKNMVARSEYFRSYHLSVLSGEQNHSQSEETNVMQRTGPCPCRKLKEDGKKFPWSAVMFVVLSGRAKDNSRSPLPSFKP